MASFSANNNAFTFTDEKLRHALRNAGLQHGPITNNTRDLYTKFLEKKTGIVIETSAPPTDTPPEQLNVISCLWNQFNNPDYVSSDTAVIFRDGTVLYVCRGVLVSVYEELKILLYNNQSNGPYPVNVVSMTGNVTTVLVRENENGLVLREKVSIMLQIPLNNIRLTYNNVDIKEEVTLSDQKITSRSVINLSIISNPATSGSMLLSIPSMIPTLSIIHLRLNYPLDMLLPRSSSPPSHKTLPSHIVHILHVHNTPSLPFNLLMGYLYSGNMPTLNEHQESLPLVYGCCAVLGMIFKIPSFIDQSLHHLSLSIKQDSTHLSQLNQLAEKLNFTELKDTLSDTNKHN